MELLHVQLICSPGNGVEFKAVQALHRRASGASAPLPRASVDFTVHPEAVKGEKRSLQQSLQMHKQRVRERIQRGI